MGLFSFLGGGKKKVAEGKPAPAAVVPKPTVTEAKAEAVLTKAVAPATTQVVMATGVVQAKLRLKLAALLRAGEREAAYEAAKGLADIQAKAGRRVGARVWSGEAEKIRAGMAA